ncbi:hypothetical protein AVEN_33626-1 [Araneus ventricosus]|uniref:Uncharacterized protein n=1 Tax=Araneus ventricosus TaxID=182803 RepID=A0A4Y2N5B5_ARAVE|nr:hypothetical protein AVEN_33626-1 [Araneus ventricosus]
MLFNLSEVASRSPQRESHIYPVVPLSSTRNRTPKAATVQSRRNPTSLLLSPKLPVPRFRWPSSQTPLGSMPSRRGQKFSSSFAGDGTFSPNHKTMSLTPQSHWCYAYAMHLCSVCVHSRSNGGEFQTETLRDDAIWEGFVGPFLQPLSPSDLGGPVTFSVGKFAGAFQDLTPFTLRGAL